MINFEVGVDSQEDNDDYALHASIGDDDANFASPTSSQFIGKRQPQKNVKAQVKKSGALQTRHPINMSGFGLNKSNVTGQKSEKETIEEALVDLYLSVKIRSNEEVSL